MTINISFATNDGQITSTSTDYETAREGSGLVSSTGASPIRVGQSKSGANYICYEGFFNFPYTRDTSVLVICGYFDFFVEVTTGTSLDKTIGVKEYAWDPLATGDWRSVAEIENLDWFGEGNAKAPQNKHVLASDDLFTAEMETSGNKQVIAFGGRFAARQTPSGPEYNEIRSIEASGTSTDPRLIWSTIPIHTLNRVAGSQVQLSDGRHVYLEASAGGLAEPSLSLKLHDGTTATNIATGLYTGRNMGDTNLSLQHSTLVRDAADNIYWVGFATGKANFLNIVTWKKTGTSTWQEKAEQTIEMPVAEGVIQNLVAAWHNVGASGTIVVMGSHEPHPLGTSANYEMFWALLNCLTLLTGIGTVLRNSGGMLASGLVSAETNNTDYTQPLNMTGTLLDIAALDNTRGVVVTMSRVAALGDYAPVSIGRYILASTGSTFSYIHLGGPDSWATKDSNAKLRVLPISTSRWAIVTVDKDTDWGPTIRVIQNVDTSATFTELGSTFLDSEGIVSLPAANVLDTSFAWDAVYQPEENLIWFYYFDQASPQHLRRTAFDLDTYQATRYEFSVNSAVAATGTTNHAIRVQRGAMTESEVLVTIANKTSGGTQSTIYVVDKLNISPTAPTLIDKANFDATTAQVFDWTFNDPNVGDTQSAYELVIENSDTQASLVSTGKVTSTLSERTVSASTLSNGVNCRWRVRTWDAFDAVGAWSSYDFFVTSAGGTATITYPVSDNPAGYADDSVVITWSTSGITQASYKVRLVRMDTGAQVSDTGYIASTATSHTISGLISDVEYRIELTVRNAALVTSNTALRLLTPDYNEPETPNISVVSDSAGGYILISATNPPPIGDKPEISSNVVQRKLPSETDWTNIAEIPINGNYRDYAVGSGITYQYRIMAEAEPGFSYSEEIEMALTLFGVWLHRPYDPQGSARNYMYGANQRGDQRQTYSQLTRYAGRELPVADFAHYHDDSVSVTLDVPFGEAWITDLEALRDLEATHETLVLRDNRGRNLHGVIQGLQSQDVEWGTQVSFDFQRVFYDEAVT